MKKITLLALSFLALQTLAQPRNFPRPEPSVLFDFDHPITFTERGVAFFVFPNGEFDFSTEPIATSDNYFRPRRGWQTQSQGIRIDRDSKGRIRRIGSVFVNYDMHDRVKRIGSVFMSYHRSALTDVGGLKLKYDMRGRLIAMRGSVKDRQQYSYQPYGQNYYYGISQNGTINENNYYYKTDTEPFTEIKN